ncbi:hypothetical protein J3492_06490 [Psychrobacter sp. F1192]|uniref:Uncharacterized protein n=1 Tax=Psychrobacter coccoides TaxID=2818440 RepID=A0ABS3NN87_9GAMM|nr:hypothetical protein [Psychrobacter coccoides]MBO1530861.1 hypothetical protein [Psychrobacter coccoides]
MKQKQVFVLNVVGKIAMRVLAIGLALISGFWLVMASNMGPAYLPEVGDGCLDMWIRMTFLAVGLLIWFLTAIWLIWSMFRYGYHLFRSIK